MLSEIPSHSLTHSLRIILELTTHFSTLANHSVHKITRILLECGDTYDLLGYYHISYFIMQKSKNLLGSEEQSQENCVQEDMLTWIFKKIWVVPPLQNENKWERKK